MKRLETHTASTSANAPPHSYTAFENPGAQMCVSLAAEEEERWADLEAAVGSAEVSSWESGLTLMPCPAACQLCSLEQVNDLSCLFAGATSDLLPGGYCEDSDLTTR